MVLRERPVMVRQHRSSGSGKSRPEQRAGESPKSDNDGVGQVEQLPQNPSTRLLSSKNGIPPQTDLTIKTISNSNVHTNYVRHSSDILGISNFEKIEQIIC